MNILSAEKISKSYSEKVLLDEISLGISEGEKIGLIGINGTGKSTFLKVLAGIESPDGGRILVRNGIRIEYLHQTPSFEAGMTVLQLVFQGDTPLMQHMDSMDAWTKETEAKNILNQLGIHDYGADVGMLSGGQRKRIAMARALIMPADLLILDEPTNHIDNITVDWLEKYLSKRKGALLMVTHDRYFLDRVCNRIIELDQGKLYSYQANYSRYLEMKAEREELEQAAEKKRQNLLRRELEWMRQGAQARSTKQKARIERFEKLQETEPRTENEKVEMKAGFSRLGRKIIELEHVGKAYPRGELIRDFNYILLRDDRIGIVGPNGSGKTTLLNLMAGRLQPDTGRVFQGETVKVGLFSQENEHMNENLRVIEYIREEAEIIHTQDGTLSASQMLERFLFPPNVQWTPVSKLSGGEKRRLYLLRVLMGAPNVLLLDEPTNDLDIQTLTILESYLDDFPGAVVVVSHDRYFLDRVAEKLFCFEGNPLIRPFTGSFTEYMENRQQESSGETKDKKNTGVKEVNRTENRKEKVLKFTYKEQKEFNEIDGIIQELEGALKENEIQSDMAASDYERIQALVSEKELLEKKLEEAIERWAYLNELAEEIERNKNG